jgi:ATP-binding cassette subfamily B protein RaxB
MVASFWGHEIDIASMRRRFSVSSKGANLKALMQLAAALGLQTRPLKLNLAHLEQLKLPCVLHWDMNHFVVLKSVSKNRVRIHDPAVGIRTMTMSDFSVHFTGVALEAIPGSSFKEKEERQQFTYRDLMGRPTGLGASLGRVFLLGVVLQIVALLSPFYMQWIVDEALISADRNLITVLGIGFILLVILQVSVSMVRSWTVTVLATSLRFQWYGNVFSHLLRLPLSYFEKRHLGDVVSRFGSINAIQSALTTQFVEGIIDGLLVITTLVAMCFYNLLLASLALIAVTIYALMRWMVFLTLRAATAEQIVKAAKQQTTFLESIRGVQAIRLFNRGRERHSLWMNALAEQMNADLRVSKLAISYQTANTFLFGIERVVIIWLAALAVLDGKFSIGMLLAFASYKDQFSQRFSSLIDKLFDLRMLRVQGDRLADIVLTEPEPQTQEGEIDVAALDGSVELRNLSFRHADSEPFIIRDLSLTIPAGQCIAITGASGCGKTTLTKVLLGLLETHEGQILIGGAPLSHIGLENYRHIIAAVMQDDVLFSGSIADNIAFFDPAADQQRIEHCAALASVDQEIKAMPMRYLTLVGDLGTGLSGGQKQRLILARALYRNPKILIMDEATSHLDVVNERLISGAIAKLAMTRIIVAHRPETIAMSDRVVVMDQGRIIRDLTDSRRAALQQWQQG